MNLRRYRVAACSWSLEPESAEHLVSLLSASRQTSVQLALEPLRDGQWALAETRHALAEAQINVVSGMMSMAGEDYSSIESIARTGGIVPDETWEANRSAAARVAEIAQGLGLGLVTFHAGFVPEPRGGPAYRRVVDRLEAMARIFADCGARIGLETGQEPASRMAELLEDLAGTRIGVNFDPANLVLYGSGDPVAALTRLAPSVLQVHIKDALPPVRAGVWGVEVPVGEGAVDWPAFLDALDQCPVLDTLVIERESGRHRVADIARAAGMLRVAELVAEQIP
ncbi:MAG: sugar phosphate isomerase/epimerase family protein [Gemmatimonadota bacterium]